MSDLQSLDEVSARIDALKPEGRAFIDGRYCDASSGETFTCISPVDGRRVAEIASCDIADADIAVAAARRVFESGVWSRMVPAERKRRLIAFADLIDTHAEELALLECLDVGKPIKFARHGDVPGAANEFRWFAELIDKTYGEVAPLGDAAMGLVVREAVGVVAAIVPWNFPLLMASWKIAPALAAGNSVILKPAEQSPLTAIRVASLASEAGIPDGVLNFLPGFGESVGQALGRHMDVDLVTFTGSTAVGKLFMGYSSVSNLKQVSLECGGKSPNIVFADAADLDKAAAAAAQSIFYNAGQVCAAASRLLVEESIADEFIEKVKAAASTFKPGHPFDPETIYGAIVDEAHLTQLENYVSIAKEEGAKIALGGGRADTIPGGAYMHPTILTGINNKMRIAREEAFGPILSVIRFKSPEEAVAIANDSEYGLQACLWTADFTKAHRVSQRLKAGTIAINAVAASSVALPFGGYKQSGFGRDRSPHALKKYTQMKTIYADLGSGAG